MHLIWDNVKVAKCNCVIQPKKEPIIFQKVRLQFRFCNQKICSVKPFRFHQPNKNFPGQIKDAWYSFFFKIYVIIIQLCDYNQSCHFDQSSLFVIVELISFEFWISVPWITLRISCCSSSWVAQLRYWHINVYGSCPLRTVSCPADNHWLANFWFNSFKRDYRNRVYSIGKQFSMDIKHDTFWYRYIMAWIFSC